jgi:hypothetical protein
VVRVSPRTIANARASLLNLATNTATIARTGASLTVQVLADTDKRGIRLEGMPGTLHIQRWTLRFPDGADVQVGDYATVAGMGIYTVLAVVGPTTNTWATDCYCIALGTPITCSVLRQPAALDPGQTAAYSTHIASLPVYPLAGMMYIPASPDFASDAFGVQVAQPFVVYAGWPGGSTELQPVQANDIITFPDASQHVVSGVQCWQGWRLAIVLELAVS